MPILTNPQAVRSAKKAIAPFLVSASFADSFRIIIDDQIFVMLQSATLTVAIQSQAVYERLYFEDLESI